MRVAGIIGGFFAIHLVNVVRIATLAWMGAKHPQVFQMFHVAVWQTLIILFSLFIFLIWSSRIAPRRLAGGV